jgi:uncharacterized membrane protein YdbT with pleckstrin-like domain
MKKTENSRNLTILLGFLAMSCTICVANIVKLNIFALIINMLMIVSICFILGYSYCKYEIEKSNVKVEDTIEDVKETNDTFSVSSKINESEEVEI